MRRGKYSFVSWFTRWHFVIPPPPFFLIFPLPSQFWPVWPYISVLPQSSFSSRFRTRNSPDVRQFLTCVCPCIVVIWEEENQLDVTQCFVELVICSTCFGHEYAHHQEPATILLVWHVVYNSWLLVVGRSGAGQQAMRPGWGMLFDGVEQHPSSRTHSLLSCTWPSDHQQPRTTRHMPH
jgi:hypothetical protein